MDERSSFGTVSKRGCCFRHARARNARVEATSHLSCAAQALVATNPDARDALARQPRALGLVERLARHEAAAGPPRDSLCETAASLARAAVLAASRVTARRGGDAAPESPDSDRGVCDAYAPDSDGSDPGPKPTLRRPSAHWKVCEKLAF